MKALDTGATIGFFGLGNMGKPMAGRLVNAGYTLLVHDVVEAATAGFLKTHPAAKAASAEDIAKTADVIVLILPNGDIVRELLLGRSVGHPTLVSRMRPGTIIVDMSSSAPFGTRDLGAALHTSGIHLIDAPVSGGVARARTGKLAVMTGGEPEIVEAFTPIMMQMCGAHIHVGPLGSGHAMKALNNYVSAAGLTAATEALRVAQLFGIDGQRAIDALNASSGRNNSTENKLSQFVLSESFDSGFSIGLMNKDLGIASELTARLGVDAPLQKSLRTIWNNATAALGPQADHTEIARAPRQ
jgi:3-hydroxyisobutyrate dehydrogenase